MTTHAATLESHGPWATARQWLQWAAVLPAAILAALLVLFPIHWMVLIVTSSYSADEDSGLSLASLPPETLEHLAMALFVPMAFVVAGAKVAPRYKLQTAVVLIVLLAVVMSASTTYVASNGQLDYQGSGWLEFAALFPLWAGGLIAGVYYVNEHERRRTDVAPREE